MSGGGGPPSCGLASAVGCSGGAAAMAVRPARGAARSGVLCSSRRAVLPGGERRPSGRLATLGSRPGLGRCEVPYRGRKVPYRYLIRRLGGVRGAVAAPPYPTDSCKKQVASSRAQHECWTAALPSAGAEMSAAVDAADISQWTPRTPLEALASVSICDEEDEDDYASDNWTAARSTLVAKTAKVQGAERVARRRRRCGERRGGN